MWTPWLFLVIVVKNKQCHLLIESIATILNLKIKHWHIHLHLSDAFIQSDLQCIQAIHLYCQYLCSLGIEPTIFALLTQCSNHWATGTLYIYIYIYMCVYIHSVQYIFVFVCVSLQEGTYCRSHGFSLRMLGNIPARLWMKLERTKCTMTWRCWVRKQIKQADIYKSFKSFKFICQLLL